MIYYKFLEEAKEGIFAYNGKVGKLHGHTIENFFEAVPLVFVPSGQNKDTPPMPESGILDLPFKTCFFEMLDASHTSIRAPGGVVIRVEGIFINELSPTKYEVYVLFYGNKHYSIQLIDKDTDMVSPNEDLDPNDARSLYEHVLRMVHGLCLRFDEEEKGQSNPRKAFKAKIGGEKKKYRINKIVFVVPKKHRELVEAKYPRQVDWSHRFKVRGHWRSLLGRIGKDREGNPIKDWTWVRDYIKGPENAPLIKKTIVIRNKEEDNETGFPKNES